MELDALEHGLHRERVVLRVWVAREAALIVVTLGLAAVTAYVALRGYAWPVPSVAGCSTVGSSLAMAIRRGHDGGPSGDPRDWSP